MSYEMLGRYVEVVIDVYGENNAKKWKYLQSLLFASLRIDWEYESNSVTEENTLTIGRMQGKTQLWDQLKKKWKITTLKSSNYTAKKILHWSNTLFFSPFEEIQFVLSIECWAIAKFRCIDDRAALARVFTCLTRRLKCVVPVLRKSDLNPTNLLFSSLYCNP